MNDYQCKVCTNSLGNDTFVVREMMLGTRENFTYFRCSSCGCLQIVEPPKEMAKYYPANSYYSYHNENSKVIKFIKYFLFKACLSPIGMFLYKKTPLVKKYTSYLWLKALQSLKKNSSVLDIGCGGGKILQEMYHGGFKNLTGIDPFIEKEIVYPSGVKIFKQDVFNFQGMYDLIMLHHSFEHMDNPQQVFKQLYRLLKPGGCLLIRVPVSDSFAWRKYGVNWFQIDAPRHFFLHTTKSMTLLGKDAGFVLKEVIHDSWECQFLFSEKYCRDVSLFEGLDFSSEYLKTCKKQAHQLNKIMDGDQACFIFKKANK